MRKISLAVVLVVTALSASACGFGPDSSREDAQDTRQVDKSPAEVIAYNNNYPNVEQKCDGHGHRVHVTTSKSVVIVPDPSCRGYTDKTAVGFAVNGQ
jgi:hypothetical protein